MSKKQVPTKQKTTPVAIPADPNALKKLKISLGIIIGLFAFILYAQSISFDYTMDDHPVTNQNDVIKKGLFSIPKLLITDAVFGYHNGELSGPIYRPASLIMFAIEWNFFGDNPHVFHFMNVLLFACTCWILFILLCKLFEKTHFSFGGSGMGLLFPFVCAILYASHPIHTEVVNNIKSRDEILCFLFGILAVYFAIKSISHKFSLNLLLSSICFFASTISKETGITFLIIIPLTIFVFSNTSTKKLILISVMVLMISGIYFVFREYALRSIRLNTSDTFLYNSVVAAPDFISRQSTVFYILLRYILLLLLPINLTCDYNFSMIKVLQITDLTAVLGILINLGIGIYALINLRKKSIVSYGILFYFISLAPVSNMFINNGATMAERFLYTPSLGYCIILAYFLIKFTKTDAIENPFQNLSQMVSFNSTLFIFLFIITSLYSIKTFYRNRYWKDDVTVFRHDVQVSDNSAVAHYVWGDLLISDVYNKEKDSLNKRNIIENAISEFNKSLTIYPYFSDTYKDLAKCYGLKNDFETSIKYYQIVFKIVKNSDSVDRKDIAEAFYNYGLQLNKTNQYEKALAIFDSAIKYKPNFAPAYNNKGVALLETGKFDDAIIECEKSIAIDPSNHNAYTNIGCAYTNLKQYEKALEYLKKSASIDSTDYYPIYIMGVTYHLMGDETKSKDFLEKANKMKGGQQK